MRSTTQVLLAVLTLVVVTVAASTASANCTPCQDMGELHPAVYPLPTTTLPTNGRIILDQPNSLAVAPLAVIKARKPRLVASGGGVYPLHEVSRYEGECSQSLMVLASRKPLPAGEEVELRYDDADGNAYTPFHYDKAGKRHPIRWRVGSGADRVAPVMSAAPTQTGAEYMAWGCGPGREIILGFNAEDTSALFARLTRKGGRTTYLLPIGAEGRVAVGHGMCHGAFYFRSESSFEVEVEVVDVAGNVAAGKWVITVTPPKE